MKSIQEMSQEYLVAEVARVGLSSIDLDRVNEAIGLAQVLSQRLKHKSDLRNSGTPQAILDAEKKQAACDHDFYHWNKISDEPDLQFICSGCDTNPNDDPVYMDKVMGVDDE